MTCIVGVVHKGRVYMGADSAGSNGWQTRPVQHPKIFKSGDFLIGYTESFRMGQLLEETLSIARQQVNEDDFTYLVRVFLEGVRATFKEYGFTRVTEGQETGGTFLIGYHGHLYTVQNDFSLIEHFEFDAVGCGEPYALAALKALEDLPPKKRIKKALKIAASFAEGVCAPYIILKEDSK